AVAKWPTSEALLIAQGRLAERQGRTGRALGHYADASKVAPTSEEPVLLRVALLRASGRDGEAVAVLERFLHRCWRDCLAAHRARLELTVTMGTGEEVTAHASALLAAAPVDRPFVVRLAEDALARGDAGVAAHLLDALALSVDTIVLRMRVLVARGQTEEAESLLARARSEALVTSEQQASLLLEMGRPARALDVLGHDSSEHSTHEQFLVGRALLALGEPRRAAQILGRIPQGSRNYEEAEHLLKTIAADSGSSRPPVGQ
ncbi:MAG: hypothetical protein KC416_16340, partial [Myxococcales bacterium]|nr:hypothetical protein [Myxococcales bacterium]